MMTITFGFAASEPPGQNRMTDEHSQPTSAVNGTPFRSREAAQERDKTYVNMAFMNTSPQEGGLTTKANRRAGWPDFRAATAFGHAAVVTVLEEDCNLRSD